MSIDPDSPAARAWAKAIPDGSTLSKAKAPEPAAPRVTQPSSTGGGWLIAASPLVLMGMICLAATAGFLSWMELVVIVAAVAGVNYLAASHDTRLLTEKRLPMRDVQALDLGDAAGLPRDPRATNVGRLQLLQAGLGAPWLHTCRICRGHRRDLRGCFQQRHGFLASVDRAPPAVASSQVPRQSRLPIVPGLQPCGMLAG